MKVTLTAKLKLTHDAVQKAALDRVALAYRDALNFTSRTVFSELEKTSSAPKMHKRVYETLRGRFRLPSQLACTVSRDVAAKYKALWTKFKDHQKKQTRRAEAGLKTRRFKQLDAAPHYVSRTLEYQIGRDYSWKKGQQVSVQTLGGRITLPYEGYQKHLDAISQGCETGAAKLWYDKRKKQYFLLVALNLELQGPQPADHPNIVGVDVGQRYHAVATDRSNKTFFQAGGQARHTKNRSQKARTSLQRKGTRSATRRLVLLSGRERRFIRDWNHGIAKRLLTRFPHSLIGLEDLTNIRERTEGRSNPNGTPKAKRVRRHRSQWSFAELHAFVAYKAPLMGSLAVMVSAAYTSQCCPKCGHCSKENRPNAGLMFVCQVCGYEGHADLTAARNIALRTLVARQDWEATGRLSTAPDVSHDEVKAAYAELRWSADTNPRLLVVGG